MPRSQLSSDGRCQQPCPREPTFISAQHWLSCYWDWADASLGHKASPLAGHPLSPAEGNMHCLSALRPGPDPRRDLLPALHCSQVGGLSEGGCTLEVALGTEGDKGV